MSSTAGQQMSAVGSRTVHSHIQSPTSEIPESIHSPGVGVKVLERLSVLISHRPEFRAQKLHSCRANVNTDTPRHMFTAV